MNVEVCPRDQARLIVEKRILVGKYILLNRIGTSPRSEVYAAEQPQLGRMVAIKLLQCDPAILSNFDREVRSVGNVKHEHVVTLYDSGLAEDGRPYIAMEYLEGEDLSRHLFRSGPMPTMRAVALWRQAVSAIAAAHRRNIVHGDLKPSNLFLTHREREYGTEEITKVIDFAIASQAARAAPPGGSAARYVAPELVQGSPATLRSDVYALGLLLLEMLTGQLPPEDDEEARGEIGGEAGAIGPALLRQLDAAPQKGRALSQQRLSPALKELIAETLQIDPARRPADAGAVLQRLRRLSEEALLGGKIEAPVASAPAWPDRLLLTKPDWPAPTQLPPESSPPPKDPLPAAPGPHEPEWNETPQMGVAMLTDLLHQLKDREPQAASAPPASVPSPPPSPSPPLPPLRRSALGLMAAVLVPGILGGLIAFLVRASGVGNEVPIPPPGKTLTAVRESSAPPPAPDTTPDLAAGPAQALALGTQSADLGSPPRSIDLSVVATADLAAAAAAADDSALKVRFVYEEEDEVTAIECTPESQAITRPAEKHGTVVEVLLRPGGSCRASGPGGSKNYKYDGLQQKRPDASGYRRIHVRLSDSGDSPPPGPAKKSADPKPITHLPKPPAPELDSNVPQAPPPPSPHPEPSSGEAK